MTESRLQTATAPERPGPLAQRQGSTARALGWALVIAGLIFFASTRSHVVSTGVTKIDDKFAHFSVYGLLGTLVCRVRGGWRTAVWSLLVVSAYGVSDEWHQSFVPGRSTDVNDWIADTIGAAIAIGLYNGWPWYRRLLEKVLWRRQPRIEKS